MKTFFCVSPRSNCSKILDNILESNTTISSKNNEGGFILVGDVDILSKICSGVFFTFQDNKLNTHGICMVGIKR